MVLPAEHGHPCPTEVKWIGRVKKGGFLNFSGLFGARPVPLNRSTRGRFANGSRRKNIYKTAIAKALSGLMAKSWAGQQSYCRKAISTLFCPAIYASGPLSRAQQSDDESFEQGSATAERLIGARSLDKAFEVQSDYARASYEGFVAKAPSSVGSTPTLPRSSTSHSNPRSGSLRPRNKPLRAPR
jgi:Phasin protein